MLENLFKLIVLFLVIFDPLASFSVFFVATKSLSSKERAKTAALSIFVALTLSYLVLLFGERLLFFFNTSIEDFQVAGGIVLGILGIKMVLGESLTNAEHQEDNSTKAIAAVIGTPLLTGPAAITAIIISVHDNGIGVTWLAVTAVLALTWLILHNSIYISKIIDRTLIQVLSTLLGLITLSWGVSYILHGLGI